MSPQNALASIREIASQIQLKSTQRSRNQRSRIHKSQELKHGDESMSSHSNKMLSPRLKIIATSLRVQNIKVICIHNKIGAHLLNPPVASTCHGMLSKNSRAKLEIQGILQSHELVDGNATKCLSREDVDVRVEKDRW
jgi:hypothetical protein